MKETIALPLVGLFLALIVALGSANAAPQSAGTTSPLFVPWNMEKPLRVSGSKPIYPQIAASAHVEGCVYVMLIVSTGSTRDATVLGGPALMYQSARAAVSTWKFKPASQDVVTVSPVCYFLSTDKGKQEGLLDSYQKTAEQVANDRAKLVSFGAELYYTGLPEHAEVQFQRALSLSPDDPEAEFDLGNSQVAEGHFDDAIAAYGKCFNADPKYWSENAGRKDPLREHENGPLLYALGQVYEKKGDRKHALQSYKDAMREMPFRSEFRDAYHRLAGK